MNMVSVIQHEAAHGHDPLVNEEVDIEAGR